MAYASHIGKLIGNTPLVKLQRIVPENCATVLLKLEFRNPSGSAKDRIALAMIRAAEKDGKLTAGGTIVEATTGNTGIALAMLAAARGYKCILTMPDNMSPEKIRLLQLYGAELVLTPAADHMQGAIDRAREIAGQTPHAFMLHQYENPANPEIHRQTTAQEIWSATDGNVDAFVCAIGTGGTISAVADIIKNRKPNFVAYGVEPAESPLISGGSHSPHNIQGIGPGFIPKNLEIDLLDGIELVSTSEAIAMRKRLIDGEGIMAGISTGASVCAAFRIAERLGSGKTVVTIAHDGGERYLSVAPQNA